MALKEMARIACSDASGTAYTVVHLQDFQRVTSLDGSVETLEGLSEFTLTTGGHVNWKDDTTFEIVASGVIIHRTGAKA